MWEFFIFIYSALTFFEIIGPIYESIPNWSFNFRSQAPIEFNRVLPGHPASGDDNGMANNID